MLSRVVQVFDAYAQFEESALEMALQSADEFDTESQVRLVVRCSNTEVIPSSC